MRTIRLHQFVLFNALMWSLSGMASDWQLKDTAGARYTLSALHDHWILVNFWAPWCPSCIEELPALLAVQKRHPDLQVLGIAVMYRTKQSVMEMVKNQAFTYPIVLGSEDTAGDFGGLEGLPTSFLYSPDGKLVGKHAGPLTQNDIEQTLAGKNTQLFTR